MAEVHATHVGFDVTVLRTHAHESAPEERLVVAYRVERRHDGVYLAMIGEYVHFRLGSERLHDFLLAVAGSLHDAVALALAHGAHQYLVYLLYRQTAREGCRPASPLFLGKCRLQELCHMLLDSLLGISLHPGIYGGVDLQTVSIEVVRLTVFFSVLVTPSVQRVKLPVQRVDVVFHHVPRLVVGPVRLLGHHVSAQEVAEINGYTVLVVSHMELQVQRLGSILVEVGLGDISRLDHLVQHYIAALGATLRVANGIEIRRVLA